MADTGLQLVVGGQIYGGWQSIRVRKSLDEMCHSFELDFMDRWLPDSDPVPIIEGDACQIVYGSGYELVLSGWVEDVGIRYDAESAGQSAGGRSNTCDLVDCSTPIEKSQFSGLSYRQVAEKLIAPFTSQMIVVAENDTIDALLDKKSERRLQAEPGMRVYDLLEEIARQLGTILQTTPAGDLLFTRARADRLITEIAPEREPLVKSASYSASQRDRFSRYLFKGATETDDGWYGDKAADIDGEVFDQDVKRYRPQVILSEYRGTKEDLGRRAVWERNTRAGRSERISYTVRGWEHADGLWEPNYVVHVDDPRLRIKADMLIVSVDLVLSEGEGTTATIEVQGPEAYDVLDAPPRRRRTRPSSPVGNFRIFPSPLP